MARFKIHRQIDAFTLNYQHLKSKEETFCCILNFDVQTKCYVGNSGLRQLSFYAYSLSLHCWNIVLWFKMMNCQFLFKI
jgi:hypothetical protein